MRRVERTQNLKWPLSAFRITVKDYMRKTTIHGVRYITDEQFSLMEHVVWIVWLVMSSAFCCVFICHIVEKWNRSPVVITFASRNIPTNEVNESVEIFLAKSLKTLFLFVCRFRFPLSPSARARHSAIMFST